MKKLGLVGLSLMLIALLAGGWLEAKEPDEWTGEIEMPYAYRSGGLTSVLNGADTEYDAILAPLISLDMKWELADKVTVFLQVENRRLVTDGATANAGVAGGDNIDLAIEQAYIKLEGFLSEKLNLTFGIQDLKFTLREGEGAFFMDVAESEGFDSLSLIAGVSTGADFVVPKDTQEFGGLTFNYGSLADDNYEATIFWGVAEETQTDDNDADDKLFGVNLDYRLPGEKNVLKVLLANISNAETDANFITIGVGADYFDAMPNLEIYGELYMQTGDREITGAGVTVDQAAQAIRIGGRYDFQHDLNPYVDLSMWSLSGDDATKTDENGDFISYENVQSTLILEDNLYGLDLDSNYTAIKVEAGIETSLDINRDGVAEPVSVKLLLGQFTANEVGTGDEDGLGTEIDITATLHYTEDLSFTLAIGMLSGGDFFDKRFLARTPKVEDTDAMTFVSFGARIKF